MQRGFIVAFVGVIVLVAIACGARNIAPSINQPLKTLASPSSTQSLPAQPGQWAFEPFEAPEEEAARAPARLACGPHYRWPIKTLSDRAASNISLTPRDTTIAALRAYPNPTPFPLPSEYPTRIAPFEYTTWRLTGVTLYKMYPPGSDEDYHVILQDTKGNQMIAETANVGCAPGTIVANQMTNVRAFIAAHWSFGEPPAPIFPNAIVTVTGVGFFDPWTGDVHPTSGAELHPLLSMMLGTPGPLASPSLSASPLRSLSPSPNPSPMPSHSPSPSPSPSPSTARAVR